MFPPLAVAASLVPSLDDVMPIQVFVPPVDVTSVHVAPESTDVQMCSRTARAASLVPSLEDVMPYHLFVLPMDVTSVHVAPESVEVQMFPK